MTRPRRTRSARRTPAEPPAARQSAKARPAAGFFVPSGGPAAKRPARQDRLLAVQARHCEGAGPPATRKGGAMPARARSPTWAGIAPQGAPHRRAPVLSGKPVFQARRTEPSLCKPVKRLPGRRFRTGAPTPARPPCAPPVRTPAVLEGSSVVPEDCACTPPREHLPLQSRADRQRSSRPRKPSPLCCAQGPPSPDAASRRASRSPPGPCLRPNSPAQAPPRHPAVFPAVPP